MSIKLNITLSELEQALADIKTVLESREKVLKSTADEYELRRDEDLASLKKEEEGYYKHVKYASERFKEKYEEYKLTVESLMREQVLKDYEDLWFIYKLFKSEKYLESKVQIWVTDFFSSAEKFMCGSPMIKSVVDVLSYSVERSDLKGLPYLTYDGPHKNSLHRISNSMYWVRDRDYLPTTDCKLRELIREMSELLPVFKDNISIEISGDTANSYKELVNTLKYEKEKLENE